MNINWCKLCLLPDTRPNLKIENNNICNVCNIKQNNSIKKINIKKNFLKLFKKKKNLFNYDCLVPVSGGKDSTWQIIKCLENNLVPLAVTWKCPSRTSIGQKNLDNLISLGVDHLDITINPLIEKKLILKCFKKYGSPAIPMHLAIFNIANRIAKNFRIPIIIWGENSAKEYGYKKKGDLLKKNLDNDWVKKYGATNQKLAEDFLDKTITKKNLIFYSNKNNNKFKVKSIFLSDYYYWDPLNSFLKAKKFGFKSAKKAKTGLYNFADIDDNFISIHHFIKWYKFGFTRLFDNLSIEIRKKRIKREKAIKILKSEAYKIPKKDILIFCKYLKITVKDFFFICEKFRNKDIWKYNKKKKYWHIPNFLIEDFNWKKFNDFKKKK